MSKESIIFTLGFVVFLTPFLGIPSDWKEAVFVGSGVFLMIIGYNLRRVAFLKSIDTGAGERHGDVFVESIDYEGHDLVVGTENDNKL